VGNQYLKPMSKNRKETFSYMARGVELAEDAKAGKRRTLFIRQPVIPGLGLVTYLNSTHTSTITAIRNRMLGDVPRCNKASFTRLSSIAVELGRALGPVRRWSKEETLKSMPSHVKSAYKQADAELELYGLQRRDTFLSCFTKFEQHWLGEKSFVDPRCISPRGRKYNLLLASFLKPFEHKFYKLDGHRSTILPPQRTIVKGLNSVERATLLQEKAKRFRNPVFMSLDGSRFDMHVDDSLLKVEHKLYAACYFGHDRKCLKDLLRHQLKNVCSTRDGIRFTSQGRRASGDINTGLGNSLLSLLFLIDFVQTHNILKWDAVIDGDDAVLILEKEDYERVKDLLTSHFLGFGMEVKIENVAYDVRQVVHCQCGLVETEANGRIIPKMVRNWSRVITKTLCMSDVHTTSELPKYLYTRFYCEYIINRGVPILQAWALRGMDICLPYCGTRPALWKLMPPEVMVKIKAEFKMLGVKIDLDKKEVVRISPLKISAYARECIEMRGTSVAEQLFIEDSMKDWNFDPTSAPVITDTPFTQDYGRLRLNNPTLPWVSPLSLMNIDFSFLSLKVTRTSEVNKSENSLLPQLPRQLI